MYKKQIGNLVKVLLSLCLCICICACKTEPNDSSSVQTITLDDILSQINNSSEDNSSTDKIELTNSGEKTSSSSAPSKNNSSTPSKKQENKETFSSSNSSASQPLNKVPLATNIKDCTQYSLDTYMLPYWNSSVIYNEAVMPLQNESGGMSAITLMYDIDKIVSVKSSDLKTVYKADVDYFVKDGKLLINPNGRIDTVEYDKIYCNDSTGFENMDGGYLFYAEADIIHQMQLAVTYVPKGKWNGPVPEKKSQLLPKTMKKLKNGEELNLLIYGDSISVGANATEYVDSAPYSQTYFNMLKSRLEKQYKSKINLTNTSVGGTASDWGVENVVERAVNKKPDLVILAFGMNDGSRGNSPKIYKKNIQQMMEKIKAKNPDCEFILVATMLQNPKWKIYAASQYLYLAQLNSLESTGCAVADVTSLHKHLLTKKRFIDMTGNNINHPNDFIVRLYAQIIYETMS